MKSEDPVSGIMTTNLVTVMPTDPLSKVHAIFKNKGFHHIPVVEHGGRLVGIISKQDLLKLYRNIRVRSEWDDIEEVPVSTFMTAGPVTLS